MTTTLTPAHLRDQIHDPVERRRAAVMRWALALLLLAAFAAWATGPYMRDELRRLEPWKVAAIFSGDAIAAIWFFRFAVSHILLGRPLEDRPAGASARWALAAFLISMIGGLALDAGFTIYLRVQESVRYDAATRVTAAVSGMTTNHGPKGKNWTLTCEWRDAASQTPHRAPLRVHADVSDGVATLPAELPFETARALQRDKIPATAAIRYDPKWPARAWLEGIEEDDNGLFWISVFVLLIQGVATSLAAMAAWSSVFGNEAILPWWMDLCKVITTAAEIAVLAFVGAVFRTLGV